MVVGRGRRVPPVGAGADDQHVAVPTSPLALHAKKPAAYVENEVVSLDGVGVPDPDAQSRGVPRNGELGDCAFLIGREHATDASCGGGWAVAERDRRYAVAASSSTAGTSPHRSSSR